MEELLFDTNILIDHMQGIAKASEFLNRTKEGKIGYVSTVTEAELFAGKDIEPASIEIVDETLSLFWKIELSSGIARTAGLIRRQYGLKLADAAIAATALTAGYKLVTRNVSDFKRISGLELEEPYKI